MHAHIGRAGFRPLRTRDLLSGAPAAALLPVDQMAGQAYDDGDGPRPVSGRRARDSTATAATEASTHSGTPQRTQPDGAQSSGKAQSGQGPAGSQRSAVWHGKEDVEEGHSSVSGCPSCRLAALAAQRRLHPLLFGRRFPLIRMHSLHATYVVRLSEPGASTNARVKLTWSGARPREIPPWL
jgi:hypothetical protein